MTHYTLSHEITTHKELLAIYNFLNGLRKCNMFIRDDFQFSDIDVNQTARQIELEILGDGFVITYHLLHESKTRYKGLTFDELKQAVKVIRFESSFYL